MPIQVWRVDVSSDPAVHDRLTRMLPEDERRHVAGYRTVADRGRAITGRAAARNILSISLGLGPSHVPIVRDPGGKPRLAPDVERATGLRFNTAHSGPVVLLAVGSGRDVGVDVEQVRKDVDVDEIRSIVFTDQESSVVARLPRHARRRVTFDAWCRKEALLKARGFGLSQPPNRIPLLQGSGATAGRATAAFVDNLGAWSIRGLPMDGYGAAVAVAGPMPEHPVPIQLLTVGDV